jgi:elongator complex protein 3
MNNQAEQLMQFIIDYRPETKESFDDAKRRGASKFKIRQPANQVLLIAYQNLLKKKSIEPDTQLEFFLRKANVRTLSGVAIITSLVKPYTCPGKCVYCPTELRMPKSYIATEPAAARALRLDFSPYEQMKRRIEMLEMNGHPTDKIEYILKGGTWNAYPLKYQYWFILESFKACNDFNREKPRGATAEEYWNDRPIKELQQALEEEQTINESTGHRIIGLTLETRPDAISPKSIHHMRLQGCTRTELGLQATDDKILELIKRGHTVQQFRNAIYLLREAGFKVDLHFMPDLPGSSPEHDIEMYKEIFSDPGLRPDMIKIYPNTVIKSAELYQWFLDGRYKSYGDEGLFRALLEMKLATPRYCRISRLIRDIPATEIENGNIVTNLREMLEYHLKKEGKQCVCLRCREIYRQKEKIDPDEEPHIFVDTYETIGGTEYFISMEDKNRIAVYGFLRLRIPHTDTIPDSSPVIALQKLMPELQNAAFIRELHVYGQMIEIGKTNTLGSQHKGYGKRLMAEAEKIAQEKGYGKIAVISGVGVRGYYEKLGYTKEGTYMIKKSE